MTDSEMDKVTAGDGGGNCYGTCGATGAQDKGNGATSNNLLHGRF